MKAYQTSTVTNYQATTMFRPNVSQIVIRRAHINTVGKREPMSMMNQSYGMSASFNKCNKGRKSAFHCIDNRDNPVGTVSYRRNSTRISADC